MTQSRFFKVKDPNKIYNCRASFLLIIEDILLNLMSKSLSMLCSNINSGLNKNMKMKFY